MFILWRAYRASRVCQAGARSLPRWQRARSYHKSVSTDTGGSQDDWNSRDEFFKFTRGRFVSDEADQLTQRQVRFDMNRLARVAAEAVGAKQCVSVDKCPEGMYSKCFIMTMDDGRDVIAKVPNPNAGRPHFTTASEVATMDFVRNVLGTPAPKVFAWSSRAESNPVGTEYIVMEKVAGVPLDTFWPTMDARDKLPIILAVARYQSAWLSASFSRYGGLYYAEDLQDRSSQDYLYINSEGKPVKDSRFAIGPATCREWSDAGRANLCCDRGPWNTVLDYTRAVARRETLAIETLTQPPKQTVMICGPGLYQPTAAKKLEALHAFLRVVDVLMPADAALSASCIWHDDLHGENIFVDPENPTTVIGIIDWQSVQLSPLFNHNPDPAFYDYDGPEPETLETPKCPDTPGLSKEERARVIRDYLVKGVFIVSRLVTQNRNPVLYQAIEFRNTMAYNLLCLSRRTFEVGEAHFRALLVELRDSWSEICAVREPDSPCPFPLSISDTQLAEIHEDHDATVRGITMAQDFKTRLGDLWPDKGAVRHDQYEDAKNALRELKDEVLREFAKCEEDKRSFEKLWPFDD